MTTHPRLKTLRASLYFNFIEGGANLFAIRSASVASGSVWSRSQVGVQT
jgi:hypothetical protein